MLKKAIEDKIIEYLKDACINDVSIYPAKDVEKYLGDWDKITDYPRIVVHVGVARYTEREMQGINREYRVDILLQCADGDSDAVAVQMEAIYERIENKLLANQRLDNLADNSNKEKVFGSVLDAVKFSDSGHEGFYAASAWLEVAVLTNKVGPFV